MNIEPIIIIAGEPYSVFLELLFKTYKSRMFKKYNKPLILIASEKLVLKQMKKLGYSYKINLINKNIKKNKNLNNKKINLINVDFKFSETFDKISHKSSKYIQECFDIGLNLVKKNKNYVLLNGPISKKSFLKKKYLGVTEYVSKKTNSKNKEVMLIYNSNLAVSPITTHLPIKHVTKNITKKKIIQKIKIINDFYKKILRKKIRFAVCGLNPHCETNDQFNEDEKIIKPAIKILREKKVNVKGPFSADTIFLKKNIKNYDVIIGMYHDQVLTPIKTLFGFNAINITLGLPFIRMSPDHGPNNQMLGKNFSDPTSLIECLLFIKKNCGN